MALRMWGQLIVQATTPAEDPVMVGTLWADTSADQLKQCSSISPYTFVTIGGTGATLGAHATQHQSGGSDPIKLDDLAAPDDNTDLNASTTAHGLAPKATAPSSGLLSVLGIGNGETVRTDKALFDTTNPAALGTAAPGTQLVAARRDHVHTLPKLDDLAAPDDNTDLNASSSTHGLLPKLSNVVTEFLNGQGGWTTIYDTVATSTSTGSQNNWAPGLARNTLVLWNGSSDITVTGLEGGVTGQTVTIKNVTTSKVAYFAHQSGSSDADNVFRNYVTSAATPIGPSGTITYTYDGSEWKIIGHTQGSFVTPAFSAGDYVSTNAAGTWTVDSGDVAAMGYYLDGRNITISIFLNTTTWAGTWNRLNIDNAAWGGFTADLNTNFTHIGYMYDNGNTTAQVFIEGADATKIGITRFDNANFTAATNLFYVRMVLTFAVT